MALASESAPMALASLAYKSRMLTEQGLEGGDRWHQSHYV
eukprot:CAMPEP_0181194948 /NCGR_PEP_ID=MMETSP1096-20121128/14614_1 /TAXON_ID=156174 ORGANISM="Chrysochromulina ericina, Strain CCMP281" /NCGR_SAMPLE_ID=MMETSP1096 /ASSEMBLY_ACC=CAM_ASM_000453 /LENGTH=39 /DNA_ID= /DNA_START= /DNA_END= /DNA_ORIENTATION=